MLNYKLTVEYDGTDFHGWQFQPNLRTVQGEIERALNLLFPDASRLTPAGRTDSGVHAKAMVTNFKSMKEVDVVHLKYRLNAMTGHDIVVHDIEIVPEEFNSRWSATGREYEYRIAKDFVAIERRHVYIYRKELDIELMQQAIEHILGPHNFSGFSLFNPKEKHYLCRVEFASWREVENEYRFHIKANRFLHGMVRILVGTSIKVGRKAITPDEFKQIMDTQNRVSAGWKVPAHGLCLLRVYYD